MLWWTNCSGERVLEDDTIPARSSEKWRHQQTWMGETSTRWSCGMFMHRAREIGRLSRLVDCRDLWGNTVNMMIEMSSTTNVKKSSCWLDAWYASSISTPRWKSSLHLQRSKIEQVSIGRTRMSRRCLNFSQKAPQCWSLTSGRRRLCGMRLQWDWQQGHDDDAYWHHIATSNTFTEVVPMGFQQKNLKRLLKALFQDHLHGDEAALTRWHEDMAMRWTLCGENMTTGRRNSAERRGLLSRIWQQPWWQRPLPPSTTRMPAICQLAWFSANKANWQKKRLITIAMGTDVVATWRQYGNRTATGWRPLMSLPWLSSPWSSSLYWPWSSPFYWLSLSWSSSLCHCCHCDPRHGLDGQTISRLSILW